MHLAIKAMQVDLYLGTVHLAVRSLAKYLLFFSRDKMIKNIIKSSADTEYYRYKYTRMQG